MTLIECSAGTFIVALRPPVKGPLGPFCRGAEAYYRRADALLKRLMIGAHAPIIEVISQVMNKMLRLLTCSIVSFFY